MIGFKNPIPTFLLNLRYDGGQESFSSLCPSSVRRKRILDWLANLKTLMRFWLKSDMLAPRQNDMRDSSPIFFQMPWFR